MKVEEYNAGHEERLVLAGMILDRTVLAQASSAWKPPGLFSSPWCNEVGSWCVKYLRRYDRPPGKAVTTLFAGWVSTSRSEATVKLVESFLTHLSDEFPNGLTESPQFVLDTAGRVFKRAGLDRFRERLDAHLDLGEVDEAEKLHKEFTSVVIGTGSNIQVLQDEDAIDRALSPQVTEPLITLPGDLGKFFGRSLSRDAFVAIMAPEKRGKTAFMVDLAWRAMLQRRRVMFFEIGDLSEEQIMQRFIARGAGRPIFPGTVRVPTSFEVKSEQNEVGKIVKSFAVVHREDSYDSVISPKEARKAFRSVRRKRVKSEDSYLNLSVHPSGSVTAEMVEAHLTGLANSGWVPDVCVIDYSDLMCESSYDNIRDQTNAIWTKLRGISQKFHCLVLTATQADAASYTAVTMDMRNFSEDKRKNAHPTGIFGINQMSDEKKAGVFRLNWTARRDAEFHTLHCVYVAGCLGIANPTMFSSF